jgi:hypothetical protein
VNRYTRWFKYDRDYLCVNKSQFVLVIFEPPCMYINFGSESLLVEVILQVRFNVSPCFNTMVCS